jgi:iron complex transport system substrate-binding protein
VKHCSLLGAALALVMLVSACARDVAPASSPPSGLPTSSGPAFPVSITDDDGVSVTIPAAPQRIVTFAPSATEILFALGLGGHVVGVSGPYDDYPTAAKGIQQVGGAGDFGVDPNIETVVSLRPDLLLTIAGGEQWKKRLRDLGIPVFTTNATDFADLLHDIGTIGRVTGATEAAAKLVTGMQTQADQIQQTVAGEPRVSCFFEVYYPPLTTVGPNTFISDLLNLAGCDSVSASAKSDYPEWSVDDLVRQSPAEYLVSSESGVSVAALTKRPGFGAIAAVAHGNVALIDSDLVSRPGPRVVDGLQLLAEALHPDAFG